MRTTWTSVCTSSEWSLGNANPIAAIDLGQQKFMGAGDQSNESAVEQAKDEQISDFIRGQYKSTVGSDMPIKDKPTTFDKSTD